jgi:GDP-L-fucose synthase
MQKTSKIYIAGHRGLVGSALLRRLQSESYTNFCYASSSELDLRNLQAVQIFFEKEKPEYVFLAAAKVGGIMANATQPFDFLYDNVQIQNNVIHTAWQYGVKKLLFLGSSCIYPKFAPQPIAEKELLNGYLESTNEAYAIAKIAGIKLCQAVHAQYGCNFICAMPTNLYGLNDNYHAENAHVLPALLQKIHQAKIDNLPSVMLWGTGEPRREFLFADDLADALLFLMQHYNSSEIINVGSADEMSIADLAEAICQVVGYTGKILWDTSKPDGTPRKKLDLTKIEQLGWQAKTPFLTGLTKVYQEKYGK